VSNAALGNFGNAAVSSSGGSGGALYLMFSQGNITNCMFENNSVTAGALENSIGGAIAFFFGKAGDSNNTVITFSQFHSNFAFGQLCTENQVGWGGALGVIGVNFPPVQVSDCRFSENRVIQFLSVYNTQSANLAQGGAIYFGLGSNLSVVRSVFENNIAVNGVGDHVAAVYPEFDTASQNVIESSVFVSTETILQQLSDATESTVSELCGLFGLRRMEKKSYSGTVRNKKKNYFVAALLRSEKKKKYANLSVADPPTPNLARFSIITTTGILQMTNISFEGQIQVFVGDFYEWMDARSETFYLYGDRDIDNENISPVLMMNEITLLNENGFTLFC
jgi:hypothetical protein